MADYLDLNADRLVCGKSVIELGAGGALPSLICADRGAAVTVITDYPDAPLVENIQYNVEHCGIQPKGKVAVEVIAYRR